MRTTPLLLVLGLSGAGLLSGLAARRLTHASVPPVLKTEALRENPGKSTPTDAKPAAPAIPHLRSADTLETLAALPHTELYSRLAAWLLDAGEQDIAAYWEDYRKKEFIDDFDDIDYIPELVFINWVRVDRSAAMAVAARTPAEEEAWAAWACHDPQGSLAAALVAGPEQVRHVVYGLGTFRPAWLRQHFNEIPEAARESALVGLTRNGDAENPLEMLKFAKEHGIDPDDSTFKALVNKDPWAALDWARENRAGLEVLVSQMAEERPGDLARLAEQSPSGEAKRKMEAALFANLIKTDPAAAIAQAKAADVPRIAAARLAAVGLALVETDPGQAFEMANHLLAACPDAMEMTDSIQLPGDNSSWRSVTVDGVTALMNSLLSKDPARLMDIIIARSPVVPADYDVFREFSHQWMQRDAAAYAEWVKRQVDLPAEDDPRPKTDITQ